MFLKASKAKLGSKYYRIVEMMMKHGRTRKGYFSELAIRCESTPSFVFWQRLTVRQRSTKAL